MSAIKIYENTEQLNFKKSDGGRSLYFKGTAGDCVVRAIANATRKDYKEIYKSLAKFNGKTVRNGVSNKVAKRYVEEVLGWKWVATMGIGTGCQVTLSKKYFRSDRTYIVRLSRHWSVVRNGMLVDNYDCSRNGTRCVYGYFVK